MSWKRQSSFITRQNREYGYSSRVGDTAKVCASLTSAIKAHRTWDPRKTISDTDHGGVFNFGFSKNGSLLGVAMERKSVLLFDAFNGKLVAKKTNAHTDCVNCVKFLDDRLFATCSDDTTVALWDARYLKHNVQTFRGHSNWVKNIEYDSSQGLLLTSGFDGCIYTWNINRYSTEDTSNRVFYTSGLMRSKLSPDFSKLIISTHEGYIIIIHDLDLSTLGEDLKGFKPNMYRLMQRSQTPLKIGLQYNHVFQQERNRVEFITDWPTGNEANIISSLQVHPQGWCILSRNTDSSENTEWTCVHDLQDPDKVKKAPSRPWEMAWTAPHTSSAYCTSTNTPAYSSQAPSARGRGGSQSTGSATENQSPPAGNSNQSNDESVMNQSGDSGTENQSAVGNSNQSNEENMNQSVDSGTENQTATESSTGTQSHDKNESSNLSATENDNQSNVTNEENLNQSGVVEDVTSPAVVQPLSRSNNQIGEGSNGATVNQESTSQTTNGEISSNDLSPNQSDSQRNQNDSSNDVRDSLLPLEDIGSDSSDSETFSPPPLRVSRGVGNSSVNQGPRPVPPASSPLTAGPMHNSLIQIRRGSRQEDGSFSFSISVHTSSGRTIMFSQEDIEADDEEDRDFTITPVNTENRSQNDGNGTDSRLRVQDGSSENPEPSDSSRGNNQSDAASGINQGGNGNRSSSLSIEINDMDTADADNDDISDIENESEHDLIDDVMMFPDSDSDSDREDNDPVQESVNINWPSHAGLNSGVNISIQSNEDTNAEPMFRHTGPSRIRRRGINTVRQNASPWLRASSSQTGNSLNSNSNSQNVGNRRVNTAANSNNPAPGRSVDVQPRSNSFMFVLESNSGTRRRRVLNLSYLDTFTETENSQLKKNIHQNTNRLLGYMEECNVGRGFIKEVAFSSDGRLISSPFGFGIRLFSFDPECNELCDCIPRSPVKLYEATCSLAHVNIVVATQFSPIHNLVVSGCLDGKIAFHQPVL